MSNDVFNTDDKSGKTGSNTDNATDDIIAQLVGEGKKFKTMADLAKGKIEADAFIEQLKQEKAEVLALAKGQEELLKALNKSGGEGNGTGVTKPQSETVDLDKEVSRILEQRTVEQKRKENLTKSVDALKNIHGDETKVRDAISKRASELGMTPKALQETAESSPTAFLTLMGVDANKTSNATAATKGSVSQVRTATGTGVKNKAYFDDLKKELGSRFWDAKVQNELFKARQELGARFYE